MSVYRNVLKTSALAIGLCIGLTALAQTPPPPTDRQTTTTTERTTDNGVTTTTTTVTKHRYMYYADHDIYFAPETRTYYWQSNGSWRKLHGSPGIAEFLKTRGTANMPDLSVGGPGFCFPVLRWNGRAYVQNRWQYDGKPCKPNR